jgi:fumarate reductase flavoprotein subunit
MKKIISLVLTAMITIPMLAGCSKSAAKEADIVVIGAGGAGLSAAIAAHDEGAKVIVLEKMPMVGGNTNRATGGLNAAGTKQQIASGVQDSVELFYEDTMKGGKNLNNPELVKMLAKEAKGSVEWLESLGADLSDVGRMAGASVNRTHRPTGGAAVGSHIVQTLKKSADDRKIDIRLWNQATEIVKDKDGKVSGVKAKDKDGKEYTIKAKSVILTTGGFSANEEMVVSYQEGLKGFATTNHPGATGDGIKMAETLGAKFVDMKEIQTHPTVVPDKGVMVTEAVRGNGAILVNKDGKRFINELETRDVVSKAILNQKDKVAYLFFDEGMRQSLKATEEYFDMGLVVEADSLEELAGKIEMDKGTFVDTVNKYNKAVEAKKDSEFNRPDMPRTLDKSKFYGIPVTPAVHHTMGGVAINTNAEVLSEDGQTIPGFYAAGEVVGGVHGANRLGGNALADIITFGRIAGTNSAKTIKK